MQMLFLKHDSDSLNGGTKSADVKNCKSQYKTQIQAVKMILLWKFVMIDRQIKMCAINMASDHPLTTAAQHLETDTWGQEQPSGRVRKQLCSK